MKRLRSRRTIPKTLSATKLFVHNQGSVLALLCLVVGGIFFGIKIFSFLNTDHQSYIGEIVYNSVDTISWNNAATQIAGSCLRHAVLLVFLFLCGLTAFGCPLILCVLIVFGFRIGIILSISYIEYGIWFTAFAVYLPLLIVGIATLLAGRRSLHMSCLYSRQLLPSGANCGGLWNEFRCYLISYTISFGLIVVASVIEVVFQILKSVL